MTQQSQEDLSDELPSIIEMFFPGFSRLFRLIWLFIGIDPLAYTTYFFPLIAVPAIATFTLPWVLGALEPAVSFFISSAEIRYRDTLYPSTKKWMSNTRFHSWSSAVIVGIKDNLGFLWDLDDDPLELAETDDPAYRGKLKKVHYTPGQSRFHIFRHEGCWFALYRDPQDNYKDPLSRNMENIFIYYFSWNKTALGSLLDAFQKARIDAHRGKIPVFGAYQDKQIVQWRPMCEENPRDFQSLAIDENMKKSIVSDLESFLSPVVTKSYERRGIPHRRGYLFYGPPGTGKTSFCRALATKLGLTIYTINLATINSYGLQELFRTLPDSPERPLVLIEDIDAAEIQRRSDTTEGGNTENLVSNQMGISMAAALNALDGIGTHTGHVLIVTTNTKPALDPALTRPGRIDNQYEFLNPDSSTIELYFRSFFEAEYPSPDSTKELHELAKKFAEAIPHRTLAPAVMQDFFLQCNEKPEAAVSEVAKLVPS
jgi:chaperone BCS1